MYQALYRKWRPQTFDQVIGQKHITETLKNQVSTGRLSHAYIFIGTRGTGKTTCARILAKAVNCENPVNGNPCCKCAACRGIADGSVMDIVELDAASNNGVDNVRALREEAVFSPTSVKKRVYIIDEVHMLSTSAFNALLKILEEPPEHLMFILATTELQKVPATVLSRCQRHSFKRIDAAVLTEYLEYVGRQESLQLEHDAAALIARLAEGGCRDALSLLDQCSASETIDTDAVYNALGLAGKRRTAMLLKHIISHDHDSALHEFADMWMNGKDPSGVLGELSALMRDVLMTHVAPKSSMGLVSGSFDAATLDYFAKRMTAEELLCAMNKVQSSQSAMRDARNPRTAAEICIVSLCSSTAGDSTDELRARLSRLEAAVSSGALSAVRTDNMPRMRDELDITPAANDFDMPPADDSDAPPARAESDEAEAMAEFYAAEPEREAAGTADDELDPAMFAEEQPEDAFIRRFDTPAQTFPEAKPENTGSADGTAEAEKAPVPAEPAEEKDPVQAEPAPAETDDGSLWPAVLEKVKPSLPIDMLSWIDNPDSICAELKNGVLHIFALPPLFYGRVNKTDIMKKFSDAASEICSRQINVVVSELVPRPHSKRDINELRNFPEVTVY